MNDPRRKKVRLGELLVDCGIITEEQLVSALTEQKRTGHKFGRVLTEMNLVRDETLQEVLAQHLKIPYVDIKQATLDAATVRLLPEALARRFRAMILQNDGRTLLVGMADPTDLVAYDELMSRLKKPLRLAL